MPSNRYLKTKVKKDEQGRRYLEGTIYPEIPPSTYDTYIWSVFGDRLDLLSNKYYGHVNYWWIIAQANGLVNGNFGIKPGTYLRIPNDVSGVIKKYEELNRKG
tara:strand:- start:139 stop:447 length:309 start_codon:yes stop_codon:yes gene_type:complete